MGRRQDGRIESGQKLTTAISARAWNRAQDAADIVLRDRVAFGAGGGSRMPGRLVVPCLVTTTIDAVIGYVVGITQAGANVVPVLNQPEANRAAKVFSFQGNVIVPATLDTFEDAKVQLGVIVGGTTFPRPESPKIVDVCIAGMCVARVRPRYTLSSSQTVGPYKFMSAAVKRTEADTDANLTGAGEASSCGTHRIIQYLGNADEEGFLQFAAVMM